MVKGGLSGEIYDYEYLEYFDIVKLISITLDH